MKFVAFGGLLFLLVMSVGCTNSTKPVAPAPTYGEIQYNGSTYVFGDVECIVACTDGGEPTYSLSIRFTDGKGRSIRFSIQDEQDNLENLVTAGEHLATGQHWDGVASWMQPASFFINYLSEGQLAVFWDQIDLQENSFTGRGYIRLKERIEHEPGYYFPAQKVWFECENGHYIVAK